MFSNATNFDIIMEILPDSKDIEFTWTEGIINNSLITITAKTLHKRTVHWP